jgi:exodeoxyribonuclease V beta subunit
MRGFIDLVFEYQGGYFLLDWKSNYLGARVEDYHQKALNQTMVEADYFLQAQIYTLALHLYLKKRKPNYRFETDIRGVYYLFVRGMGTRRGHRYGIFEYHPTQNEIIALAHGLGLDEP